MSTRSFIGVELSDGTIRSVYCHYDGYIANQKPLLERYSAQSLVEELVSWGNMSYLGETIDDTKYYSRDLGEPVTSNAPSKHRSKEEFSYHAGREYCYLWSNGEWFVSLGAGFKNEFRPLTGPSVRNAQNVD